MEDVQNGVPVPAPRSRPKAIRSAAELLDLNQALPDQNSGTQALATQLDEKPSQIGLAQTTPDGKAQPQELQPAEVSQQVQQSEHDQLAARLQNIKLGQPVSFTQKSNPALRPSASELEQVRALQGVVTPNPLPQMTAARRMTISFGDRDIDTQAPSQSTFPERKHDGDVVSDQFIQQNEKIAEETHTSTHRTWRTPLP